MSIDSRIIYNDVDGTLNIVIPTSEYLETHTLEDLIAAVVPKDTEYFVVSKHDLPEEARYFRNAWVCDTEAKSVHLDLDKAKDIAHKLRRKKREEEFAPLDALIAKRIPGTDEKLVDQDREQVRQKYSVIQEQIDEAATQAELLTVTNMSLKGS